MDKPRILVTGAHGQLGRDLTKYLGLNEFDVWGLGRKELDITNIDLVKKQIERIRPDVIIHSAAYTNVDLAETEPEDAFRINALGSGNIAIASEAIHSKLVYISTDYVFDGLNQEPYHENYRTNPINVYGKSKLAGEQLIKLIHSRYFIVRTSWVYGLQGNNFVKTMLKLAEERDSVSVVSDQVGSPTYTVDLTNFIIQLIDSRKYGIYHATNSGQCSWYEFAKAIFEAAGINMLVLPIKSDAYPSPAKRPAFSVMEHRGIELNGFVDIQHWRNALSDFIKEIYGSSHRADEQYISF